MQIDLNCDMGEGAGHDAELMAYVSSANIACGGHAGTIATMRETIALARAHGVAAGAHPGFADRENFGRRELPLSPLEVRELVITQVSALRELGPLCHVKPHGALYNLAARHAATAEAVAAGVKAIDPTLVLIGLAGGKLLEAGRAMGLTVAAEAFADRSYGPGGRLLPRSESGAVIEDEDRALAQVMRLIRDGVANTTSGDDFPIAFETICVHGDNPAALKIVRRLARELQAAEIRVLPLRRASIRGSAT